MVIYRKYRPKTFKEVIGQENIVQILENEIKSDKVAHAYLFTGPRGLGKTTLSRLMAKAVNCLNRKNGESEPCNKCDHCQSINNNRFIDLIELDAASQTGVDNVRENIIAYSRIPPAQGKYKVFVIDECHMLSLSAFNALLKILEEPPKYVIFILATTEIHKLPETIISRCQRFDFNKVSMEKIVQRMETIMKQEKIKVDKKVLQNIASRSEGCVRDAESLLGQLMFLNDKNITEKEASLILPLAQTDAIVKFLQFIFKKDKTEAVKLINELLEQGINLDQFVVDLIEFLRKIMLIKIKAVNKDYWLQDENFQKKADEMAGKTELKTLISALDVFIKTKIQLGYSEIPQLPLELAVLKICEEAQPK
ncbi:MAG: DNA polymerase III subunit gamma/tau [Patescibacteria group bacterium]|jgi:DNA polymerase-3 subunit gamma/tau|nr:DNA polymerase III subunit gamma/tau [Patescibacteria group bacterium]MDD5172681.1 DNA polymerase III subunit gamma/tau [Patescibacteria group bacterium]